jgi:hypothetical protein
MHGAKVKTVASVRNEFALFSLSVPWGKYQLCYTGFNVVKYKMCCFGGPNVNQALVYDIRRHSFCSVHCSK